MVNLSGSVLRSHLNISSFYRFSEVCAPEMSVLLFLNIFISPTGHFAFKPSLIFLPQGTEPTDSVCVCFSVFGWLVFPLAAVRMDKCGCRSWHGRHSLTFTNSNHCRVRRVKSFSTVLGL